MGKATRHALGSGAVLCGATALALLVISLPQHHPPAHLALLFAFLLASGGLAILAGAAAARWPLPAWARSLRSRLIAMCVITAVLGLVNAGFTTALMLLSTRDLAVLAGLLVCSLGVSVCVAFAASQPIANSIHETMAAVRRISAGSLHVRAPVHSRDEVGELAAAVNAMTQRLEDSFARERELDQARVDLILALSHDLLSPLTSIRAMVESINDGVVHDPATVRRYLRSVNAQIDDMTQLIDDLLELSRMDAVMPVLRPEPASIADLISDTVAGMSARAAARGLVLHGTVGDRLPRVMMDAPRVQRVLNNLVQNAITHTPPPGTVTLSAREDGDQVRVDVIDTGPGPPQEEFRRRLRAPADARLRRLRPRVEHRRRHRRGPRRPHPAGKFRRPGQRLQLHPAQRARMTIPAGRRLSYARSVLCSVLRLERQSRCGTIAPAGRLTPVGAMGDVNADFPPGRSPCRNDENPSSPSWPWPTPWTGW